MRARTRRLPALVLGTGAVLAILADPAPARATLQTATRVGGSASPPPPAGAAYLATPEEALQLEIDRVLRGSAGERATVGAEVVSLSRGDVLYALNAERLLQPASNVKLFTAAAALHYLGPRFTFRTTLYATGPVDEHGVLRGDLLLEGRGDPNLSGRFYGDSVTYVFDRMAESLRSRGIARVAGDLVADNTYFEGPELGEGWAWDTQQWWYSAQIDALSFNDNTITIVAEPGSAPNEPARIRKVPETDFLAVNSDVRTVPGRSSGSLVVKRAPESNVVELSGRVGSRGAGVSVIITVDDPARYAAAVLRGRLLRAGIAVDGRTRLAEHDREREGETAWTPLASHFSPPLSEVVKVVNKRSQNFYAEQLLKTVGAEVKGRGTAEAGIAAIDEFLVREVGLEPGSIYLVDGSGLSRLNLVTPRAIVRLLAHMARHPHAREFHESLAVAGEDAPSGRLAEPLTRGNVHAKTGTVRYVSAYSGYVTTAGGERLAFAILLNNRPGGKAGSVLLENAVVRALARWSR